MRTGRTDGPDSPPGVRAGDWVEIVRVVLAPEERLATLPEDTRSVPYEARIRGYALRDAAVGDEITIETRIGRVLSGSLVTGEPRFAHDFGRTVPELLWIGPALRRRLFGSPR